jgi:transcriptional regulator with XRE-family HTH domain
VTTSEPDETEQRFAGNFRVARERAGLTGTEVAEQMRSRGFPWHQQTISRVESGAQRVRIGEATALASIVGMSLDALMRPADLEMAAADIMSTARKVREARKVLDDLQRRYDADAGYLRQLLERARANGTAERLRGEIRAGMSALGESGRRNAPDQDHAGQGPVDDGT